jgi:hypothetical protein
VAFLAWFLHELHRCVTHVRSLLQRALAESCGLTLLCHLSAVQRLRGHQAARQQHS